MNSTLLIKVAQRPSHHALLYRMITHVKKVENVPTAFDPAARGFYFRKSEIRDFRSFLLRIEQNVGRFEIRVNDGIGGVAVEAA